MTDCKLPHTARSQYCFYGAATLGVTLGIGFALSLFKAPPFKGMSAAQLQNWRWALGSSAAGLGMAAAGSKLSQIYFSHAELTPAQKALGSDWRHRLEEDGHTPLHQATGSPKHIDLCRALAQDEEGLDAQTKDGQTPLHCACNNNNAEAVRALIAAGANLEIKDENGNTPFLVAARSFFQEGLQQLADAGADVHVQNNRGDTALHCSLLSTPGDITKLLLTLGLEDDIDVQDDSGRTVLHEATQRDVPELLRAVLTGKPNLEIRDGEGHTALQIAAEWRSAATVALLLDAGADVQVLDSKGRTLLHFCLQKHVDRFLEAGLALDAADSKGRTPLHAASESLFDLVKLEKLLEKGADVNARDAKQRTPLHMAGKGGGVGTITALLRAGADINAVDAAGNTALHYAAGRHHEGIVTALLKSGADKTIRNGAGKFPSELVKVRHIVFSGRRVIGENERVFAMLQEGVS